MCGVEEGKRKIRRTSRFFFALSRPPLARHSKRKKKCWTKVATVKRRKNRWREKVFFFLFYQNSRVSMICIVGGFLFVGVLSTLWGWSARADSLFSLLQRERFWAKELHANSQAFLFSRNWTTSSYRSNEIFWAKHLSSFEVKKLPLSTGAQPKFIAIGLTLTLPLRDTPHVTSFT